MSVAWTRRFGAGRVGDVDEVGDVYGVAIPSDGVQTIPASWSINSGLEECQFRPHGVSIPASEGDIPACWTAHSATSDSEQIP